MKGHEGGKCECNWGLGIAGVALIAVGIWAIVGGFLQQTAGAVWYMALAWYFGGAFAFGIGKMLKMKAMCMHCMGGMCKC